MGITNNSRCCQRVTTVPIIYGMEEREANKRKSCCGLNRIRSAGGVRPHRPKCTYSSSVQIKDVGNMCDLEGLVKSALPDLRGVPVVTLDHTYIRP